MTMYQRAAHEFSKEIFEEAKEIFPNSSPYDVKQWADSGKDSKESQGVTPLLIASSTRDEHILELREQFITYLIKDCHADVKCMHSVTKWTPLHWIARYGDIELCKLMLENHGDAFTPDNKGYFPIDYAGYFQHEKMVKVLVEHSIEEYKKSVERYKTAKPTREKL